MANTKKFLLVDEARDQHWHAVLREALVPLGTLQIENESDSLKLIMTGVYDLVIVDAAAVKNVPLFVARARAQRPDIGILVVTADPSWLGAREALQAGATDYIGKFLDREETFSALCRALKKTRRC